MHRFRTLTLIVELALLSIGLSIIPAAADTVVVDTARVAVASDGTQANHSSYDSAVSADGGIIVFSSPASNLVAGDGNAMGDIFAHYVATGTTTKVSNGVGGGDANDRSYKPDISGDGSVAVFESYASNLVVDDTNGNPDVFAYNIATGITTRISVASDGSQADRNSYAAAVSADGSTIVFRSSATNLIAGETNDKWNIFAHDVATGTTTRVSAASGGVATDFDSSDPAISADGSTIVYESKATNLAPGDTNGTYDIFAYDVATGTTTRVSVATDGTGANGRSDTPTVSADGGIIVYQSAATNLVGDDTNGALDIFVRDVVAGTTSRIPVGGAGTINDDWFGIMPALSSDGTTVVYHLERDGVANGGIRDVFIYDLETGSTTQVTYATDGSPTNGMSARPDISSNASVVVFNSEATNMVTGPDVNGEANDVLMVKLNVSPEATGFDVSIAEDASVGTSLGTVTADDRDLDSFGFSITGGDPGGLFTIDAVSGEVTTAGQLDYESATGHTLTVSVSDGHSSDTATVTITVTDADPFDDVAASVFVADIEWLAESGITKGCGPRQFCPYDNVTRGQMAAFLTRALDLPPAAQDHFTDDEASIFEDSINRLADAGITKGCGATTFCPEDTVTRGQMAAFLVRGLGYTDDGGGDLFVDDDNSIFEHDIDKLAFAGVTRGCDPPANSRFCPTDQVTREQMAAFLRRALDG